MGLMPPFNLKNWIEDNRHLLKPPVGNAQLWRDSEFIIMLVGGPNARKDFHVDKSEEFFYQLEGSITLRVVEDGAIKDLPIREGEVFLLPPLVPHSPQRPAGTVGLVIERVRKADEADRFQWYCENCHALLHDVEVHVTDIVNQLKQIFNDFYGGDAALRTCKSCGTVMQPPG